MTLGSIVCFVAYKAEDLEKQWKAGITLLSAQHFL